MRSAPCALVNTADAAFATAARAAQITHGHPTGYYAAGAPPEGGPPAAIVAHLVAGDSLEGAVLRMLRLLRSHPATGRPRPLSPRPSTWPSRARRPRKGRVAGGGLDRRTGPRHRRVLRARRALRAGRSPRA
ncbi:ADP-ribosylglycohydrolase family protein [Streptomyces sp. AS02]|uniref:ADP-ribosylglycohydrolase family protein n=1 Tax=Streptomyces sp. AS02 TaxID=2938946 RepID=UPI0027BB1189|nr:ADP-ribosylglycohydrolase family protein [Streptomyces sp. AS02]